MLGVRALETVRLWADTEEGWFPAPCAGLFSAAADVERFLVSVWTRDLDELIQCHVQVPFLGGEGVDEVGLENSWRRLDMVAHVLKGTD